jgi:hypothetical protein
VKAAKGGLVILLMYCRLGSPYHLVSPVEAKKAVVSSRVADIDATYHHFRYFITRNPFSTKSMPLGRTIGVYHLALARSPMFIFLSKTNMAQSVANTARYTTSWRS